MTAVCTHRTDDSNRRDAVIPDRVAQQAKGDAQVAIGGAKDAARTAAGEVVEAFNKKL